MADTNMTDENTSDQYEIRSVAALRAHIGECPPGLDEKNTDHLNEFAIDFIAKSPFLILATSDAQGRLDASPKGDAPGFVEVVDERTLIVPDRPGNKLAYGHLNIIDNARAGLIFILPGTAETLRVNGKAALSADPALLEKLAARGKPATLAMRIDIEEVFFHCAKAFIRSKLWQPDSWLAKQRISFGAMYARQRGADAEVAAAIDARVEQDYVDNL
jgi:PPOX class probable FMN-dependent enzyme